MMFKSTLFVAILLFSVAFLNAQNGSASGEDPESAAASDEEYVETLYQPVKADSNEAVTMFQAADQSLFVLPTAYTMPKGTSALTSYEILILQYAYAPVENLHISAGTVFPIHPELLRSLTLGAKFNYLRSNSIQAAFYGSVTPFIEDVAFFNIGHVISIGDPSGSFHVSINKPFGSIEDAVEGGWMGGVGFIAGFSPRVAGIGEVHLYLGEGDPEAAVGLGLRFKGKSISWDLAGFRPITLDMGEILALPFIKATFLF